MYYYLLVFVNIQLVYCIEWTARTRNVDRFIHRAAVEDYRHEHGRADYGRTDTSIDVIGVDSDCRILGHVDEERMNLPHYNKVTRHTLERKLGQGGQGQAFLIRDDEDQLTVKKIVHDSYDALIEHNAMLGLQANPVGIWHHFGTLGVTHGRIRRERIHARYFDDVKMEGFTHEGMFCVQTTYVPGRNLNSFQVLPSPPGEEPIRNLAFFLMALRQIQSVHFSLNENAIFDYTVFERGSYGNHHGDIHGMNIIVPQIFFRTRVFYVPILIDYGISTSLIAYGGEEYVGAFYNKIQREEANLVELNHIHRFRLFNAGQRKDYCMLAILLILITQGVLDRFRAGRVHGICNVLGDTLYRNWLRFNEQPLRFLPVVNRIPAGLFRGIINDLLFLSMPYSSYIHWDILGRLMAWDILPI